MNVMLISQCSKQALVETRRVLDQFAERKGERTWQTAITRQGLLTLRKMLRKFAKRNTAVACHWIKSANRTELLWIVGSTQRFNDQGTVPTNTTQRDIIRSRDENLWHTVEDISLLAGIAGLFHDFGKANALFQKKLRPTHKGKSSEPYRHDWVSLRLFQAFVGDLSDRQWLEKLHTLRLNDEEETIAALIKDGEAAAKNPFKHLPSLAQAIGWLILAHHRLPKWPGKKGEEGAPRLTKIDRWLYHRLSPAWNSPQCLDTEWSSKATNSVWKFNSGLPIRSKTWQAKAHSLARRALKRPNLINGETDWLADAFSLHLARMVLMLADHSYSAHEATPAWQDRRYKAFANTDRRSRTLKQRLDEHVVGVAHYAVLLAKSLPTIRRSLPAITRHRGFKKRSADPRFRWQDKSYELACGLRERSREQGFFGINMASTGCGKTFANGRIMYGLADEKQGCRFNVALGLRTLTLQTGDALRNRLRLEEDDLAVLIGSQAVQQLHEYNNDNEKLQGSESAEELLDEFQHVRYEGALDDGRLSEWLRQSPKLHRLVSAPILVSTIDHLIPATEGERGGKQIAPMLRLLTSDLVLDEPDEFDLADLPALTRLVNWAGMLGCRVLISSATLPPALIEALFDAYLAGRRTFQKSCGEPGRALNVCCAWFDENKVAQSDHAGRATFAEAHGHFVSKRIARLKKAEPVRQAALLPLKCDEPTSQAAITAISAAVSQAMPALHAAHGQNDPQSGKRLSVGLIRMANINPMVAVAKQLLATPASDNHRIHYCIYHSQHPLAVRSAMERQLDSVLSRHDPQGIWQQESIREALAAYPEKNHLFVVLATSVAEVGRDHDYDWAIAEPSSMRSLIQLAGRILRHRNRCPAEHNLLILSRNYRALLGKPVAFEKPGFESGEFPLHSHDLHDLLEKEQYRVISSIPRIVAREALAPQENLADLEHVHLVAKLFGSERMDGKECAALWWRHAPHWCFELQRRMPFRKSAPDNEYVLYLEAEGQTPEFHQLEEGGGLKLCDTTFERVEPVLGKGVSLWGENDMAVIAAQLTESMDLELNEVSRRFGVLRLRDSEQRWFYHPALGVHGELG